MDILEIFAPLTTNYHKSNVLERIKKKSHYKVLLEFVTKMDLGEISVATNV